MENDAGGESVADNCQILQTRVNRFKADKDEVDKTRLQGYSCDINFTGMFLSSWLLCFFDCGLFSVLVSKRYVIIIKC